MELEPSFKTEQIESEIAKRIAAAGIHLRFDKVALRLLDAVGKAVGQSLAEDESIAFTVTAPIKLPAKTSAAIQEFLRQLRTAHANTTINGNEICARVVKNTSRDMPRVIGFVHNPADNVDLLLEMVESSLREG